MSTDPSRIRNFSIIAHIDHGKSTLADRILDVTGVITDREKQEQLLDRMDIERERGITVKAQSVRLPFRASDGQVYQLNLIDTPGHVDFTYEVSRLENDLEIIPVFNKIDLPSADVERVRREVEEVVGLDCNEELPCSGKTGMGVREVLEAVVRRIPPPKGDREAPLRALLFDSWYDPYRGAVCQVRIVDGRLSKGDRIKLMATGGEYEVTDLHVYSPFQTSIDVLEAGEVGCFSASIKSIHDTKVGDTVTLAKNPATEPLAGFKEVKPMVFCGVFPTESEDYPALRDALEKLRLNDAALVFEPETSDALGFGFRCGFLGLLHMEIIQERLEREHDLSLVTTAPTVVYHVYDKTGEMSLVENPSRLPDAGAIDRIEEPYYSVSIHVPSEYVGAVIAL